MKLRIALLSAVCALTGPAIAADDLETCAQIPTDKYRLACYDRVMGHTPTKKSEKTDIAWRNSWIRSIDKSEFNDTTNVFLRARSKQKYESRFKSNYITLIIACRENKTNLWFNFGGLFMSDLNHSKIEYRIDKQKPASRRFRESNNHEALGLWSGASAIPFIKSLFGSETLLIRATPHIESAVTGHFQISGLEEAIKPLREACNW
ncbi:type VI secretion system-associated protein TagO [uncultured Roseibium sp.]|uniref:type VI secretion system-associated protein TagO n=1 Tax=uncultured Roseibium sp. TaxID=1936171 RepID=UPI0026074423|nr:type VI secretion system-associated protein TagO [uncultured Roseibium sp.]